MARGSGKYFEARGGKCKKKKKGEKIPRTLQVSHRKGKLEWSSPRIEYSVRRKTWKIIRFKGRLVGRVCGKKKRSTSKNENKNKGEKNSSPFFAAPRLWFRYSSTYRASTCRQINFLSTDLFLATPEYPLGWSSAIFSPKRLKSTSGY